MANTGGFIETCDGCGQQNNIPVSWPLGKMVICGTCKARLAANDDDDIDDDDLDDEQDALDREADQQ